MTVTLFSDQIDLVSRVRTACARHKGVLMQSATGSGKTVMSIDMIAGSQAKGKRCIFTVPRKELLDQTIATVRRYGFEYGVISPDYPPNPFAKVQIAMTPTLSRRLDKIRAPDILFVDECHYGGAEMERIIDWSRKSGGWRIGMSATPLKTSGKGMGDWYDHMEEGAPISDLMASGRLSSYRYFAPSAPDLSGISVRNGEYVQSQLESYMEAQDALIGDAVKTYRDAAAGKLNVVFATSRKHSGIIRDAFVAAGIPAMTIDGTMSKPERGAIIRGFAMREFTVLVSVQLLTFGFDLSAAAEMDVSVEAMSDLCPRKSLPMQMQVWGRVLRAKPYPAIIMDHASNWRENGMPDDPREWSLAGRVKRQIEEKTVSARQCPKCFFVHRPIPACPKCGHVYEIKSRMVEERDGDLIEVNPEQMRAIKKDERRLQGQADSLASLLELAKRTGRNPGWAHHVWRARQSRKSARS